MQKIVNKKSQINWNEIHEKLPYQLNNDAKKRRDKMFSDFDLNQNGFLSLSEVLTGIQNVLCLQKVFDAKPVIMRAFMVSKNIPRKSKSLANTTTKLIKEHGKD